MFIAAFQAMGQARRFNMNPLKILPGLLVEYDKIYMLSQFGAATEKLEKATIHGDLDSGIQFIGQSQGLINDVATVEEILTRVVKEALEAQAKNAARIVQ
jgi:enoyl-[acyl-carrier protein] reductase II